MARDATADVNGPPTGRATSVGSGILASRITGLARDVAFAAFLGTGVAADAWVAAIKIPNIIRNLLGEGTLSASFVPVYSDVLVQDEENVRRRLASSVLGFLIVVIVAIRAIDFGDRHPKSATSSTVHRRQIQQDNLAADQGLGR